MTGPKPTTQRRENRRQHNDQATSWKQPSAFPSRDIAMFQNPQEDAPPFDLSTPTSTLRCMTSGMRWTDTPLIEPQPPFTYLSLDDLFGTHLGLSAKFNNDATFRRALRAAIRQDIFDTTPYYANLSERAASLLLLPDSSLEGSWKNKPAQYLRNDDDDDDNLRMKHTTKVLHNAFAYAVPTGDELFAAIGALCGSKPSTHWIDIIGVQDRKVSHSWHQDFGSSPQNSKTVLWGFPPEDGYKGAGVFSHVISLKRECIAPEDHPRMEPVLFDGTVPDEYIVRPHYAPGRELLMYRDVDVLHSSPDVTYRTSLMRFM